jgi:DNA-binding MarR family transcriptional regulator
MIADMDGRLPLSALLSHALVAFTIEFDNEFERRAPHRTTNHAPSSGARDAPWLVSMVMWTKFLRFVPDAGVSVSDLQLLTQLSEKELRTWLTRLSKWWRYVVVEPDPARSHAKNPTAGWIVRPTAGGRKALEVWRPLTGVIESRWEKRFGKAEIENLKESLRAVVKQMDVELPGSLPILGYGLFNQGPELKGFAPPAHDNFAASACTLPALLSKALLAFALEFERDSDVSLAISANVLRVIGDEGVRVRDLPRLTSVSNEAINMALGWLEKRGHVAVEKESTGSRVKVLRLTAIGKQARDAYHRRTFDIEKSWQARFSEATVHALREALEKLALDSNAQSSSLFHGLETYPEGWRASVPKPDGFPHFPMILHRGGFPDGS